MCVCVCVCVCVHVCFAQGEKQWPSTSTHSPRPPANPKRLVKKEDTGSVESACRLPEKHWYVRFITEYHRLYLARPLARQIQVK